MQENHRRRHFKTVKQKSAVLFIVVNLNNCFGLSILLTSYFHFNSLFKIELLSSIKIDLTVDALN